jgi:gliding motility-associated-like protein
MLTTAFSNAPGSSSTKEVVILEATPVVVTPVACHGGNGSLSVQINGMPTGLSYTWTGYAAQTVPQIQVPAGNYDVRIEATNACSVTRSIVLTQPDALSVTGTTTPASCTAANGSVQTQIAGGTAPYTYSWSDGSTNANLSDVTAGSYTLTVTDSRNCTTTESFTVSTDAGTLQIQINTTDAICTASNGAATAVVTGGTAPYTYTWDNGNTGATLTGIAPGNYSVSVTDANGCSVTEGTTVNATTQNLQVQVQTQPTGCGTPSGSATVTVTGGTAPYTYHWSNGGNTATITGLDAGNYSVIVTDANGCTTTVPDIRIEGTGNLQVFFTTEDSYCTQSNGSIEATVSGGNAPYTYQWSNGQTTQQIENLSPGDYSVTITDNGGCVFNSHTITVQSIDYVPNVTAQITPVICTEKGSIRLEILNGEGPYSYQWTNGAITATAAQLEPGIYGVTVTDIRGCKAVLTDLEVTESTQTLPVTLGGPKNVCDGESVTLNPGIYETYQWSDGSTNSTLVVTEPGSYSVQVTDRNGCSGSASIDVTGNCGGHIYFPSAFTPDGDGLNDVFGAAGIVPGIKKFKLVIFNRWGQKVFESNRIEDKWDGTYKGKIYSTQTFTWYAEYRIDNNPVMTEKGTLLLIR